MANIKQRPARERDLRMGQTYYMPVPAYQLCRSADEVCTCVQAGLQRGQGCSRKPGGCLIVRLESKQQLGMARHLVRDGVLLYRSKAKAKAQGRRGKWIKPFFERERFKDATKKKIV